MELEPAAILAVLWVVLSIVGRLFKGGRQQTRPQSRQRAPQRAPQPTTFDDLLEDMRRQVEEAKQRGGHPDAVDADSWSEQYQDESELIEDRTVWEEDPTVVSMEGEAIVRERDQYDHDTEAELITQRRIQEALARNRAWRLEDHRQFDHEIRDLPAASGRDRKVVRRNISLRDAMVWREVLSPPVAMRADQSLGGNDLP